jgi:putative ubiquitin-RnfH superfamily antitoxin RatB of RatAB toxin-antitoxin module
MRYIVTAENIEVEVEVAYAKPDSQVILQVKGVTGMTVLDAIEQSGIAGKYPEIEPAEAKVGIFGKATKLDVELKSGDRVEIYRPLIADPKEVRKRKAAEKAAAEAKAAEEGV